MESSVKEQKDEKIIFALLNTKRQKEYRIGTLIDNLENVRKIALDEDINVYHHLENTCNNMKKLADRGIKTIPYIWDGEKLISEYFNGLSLCDVLYKVVKEGDIEQFYSLLDRLLKEIETASDEVEQERCIIYEFGLDEYTTEKNYGKILAQGYLDMIPRNCFVSNHDLMWIDQEWMLENVPSKYILYKGILEVYNSFPDMHDILPIMEVIKHYGIDGYFNVFVLLNRLFMNTVIDNNYAGVYTEQKEKDVYWNNIRKIIRDSQ